MSSHYFVRFSHQIKNSCKQNSASGYKTMLSYGNMNKVNRVASVVYEGKGGVMNGGKYKGGGCGVNQGDGRAGGAGSKEFG